MLKWASTSQDSMNTKNERTMSLKREHKLLLLFWCIYHLSIVFTTPRTIIYYNVLPSGHLCST